MTSQEIKQILPMKDLLSKLGIKVNRAGFMQCPFHQGDRTASLKVYKDSAHCFGCGWDGDIFRFYQDYNGCDFKTAFLALGGEYERKSNAEKAAMQAAILDRKREQEKREIEREKAAMKARLATNNYWDAKELVGINLALYGPDSGEFWDAVEVMGNAEFEMARMEEVMKEYE